MERVLTGKPSSTFSERALAAGSTTYIIWGLTPLMFQLMGHLGVGPWEILTNRMVWGLPAALLFVAMARQGGQLVEVLRDRRALAWLALCSALITVNWSTFIAAVNHGHVLETSLGYYILPLFNMAAGAVIFRERLGRIGLIAIALAAVGVVLQTLALGHLPIVSLLLALSFCGYGIVRKRVAIEAQTGLAVECLLLALPALIYVIWLQASGGGHLAASPLHLFLLVACGPVTAVPLVLFSWAARRLPLSMMGFLQFITPTITFFVGIAQGEAFTPLRAISFVFIWAGVAVFAADSWARSRKPAIIAPEG